MLLAIDIGNSSIKFGVFDGETLASKSAVPTHRDYTADELGRRVGERLGPHIADAVACSVVPQVDDAVREFIKGSLGLGVAFIDNSFDFGLKIRYQPLNALGTDRLVNAFAAVAKYGARPLVVCSFGTATTIDAVSASGEFLGGVIAPGMQTMAKALHIAAARLPQVEITRPASVIGNSTADSIRSGVYHGYIALVEGLVQRISAEFADNPTVIATGGLASTIASECRAIDRVDENLTLEGLRLARERTAETRA